MEKKIPKLRFPEFEGEWVEKKLGEISENIMYGMNSAAIEFDGNNKYLRITDIDESSRTYIPNPITSPNGKIDIKYKLKDNDLVFARTGASVGKSYLYNRKDGNLFFAGFLIRFSITYGNPYFVYTQTLRDNYDKWVQLMSMRSGQPGINAEEYKTFSFKSPTLPEQTKIANFLSAVDDKITQFKKKKELLVQYKKGVMQKIFSQELRFKDENGEDFAEWKEKKLGECILIQGGYAFKSEKFGNGETLVIRIGDILPNMNLYRFTGVCSIEKPSDKYLVKKGDFMMALSGATFGKVGKIIDEGHAYINQRVATFRTNQCLEYFYQLVQTIEFKNYINSIPSASAQPNISNDDIIKYETLIPSLPEQTKIANFLSAIDDKINHCGIQIEKMEAWKKGLLQQMFV